MRITYTDRGADGFFSLSPIKTALINSAIRIAKVVEEKAIKDYREKRKTSKEPSLIINSFDYDLKSANEVEAVAVVQAGGPIAPHIIYVHDPHKLKGGKGVWPGYKFLDVGMEEGEKQADKIIKDEFEGKQFIITGGK